MVILVSAGHHAAAKGAAWDGFSEYPETSRWADAVIKHLADQGGVPDAPQPIRVPDGTLPEKVAFINDACRSVKVFCAAEIHFNSAGVVGVKGSETLYARGSQRGHAIAQIVQEGLGAHFTPDRGVKEGWYRMDRPGIKDYEGDVEGDEVLDYFLRKTICPAIIIEPDFIQNYPRIIENRNYGPMLIASRLLHAYHAPAA